MKARTRKFRPCRFTEADRAVLESYRPVVDALGTMFGPYCQVVLGSLEEPQATVVALANGDISHRYVGEPVMPDGLDFLEAHAWLGAGPENSGRPQCREIRSSDGRRLKNINVGIFNGAKLIGYLGLNLDMDVPVADFVEGFRMPESQGKDQSGREEPPRHFDGNSSRFLAHSMETARAEEKENGDKSAKLRVKRMVARLEEMGAFNVRGSVDFVAQCLGVSRNTIYLHLRSLKGSGR